MDLEDPRFSGLYRFVWDAETVILLTRMSRVSKPRNHVCVKKTVQMFISAFLHLMLEMWNYSPALLLPDII